MCVYILPTVSAGYVILPVSGDKMLSFLSESLYHSFNRFLQKDYWCFISKAASSVSFKKMYYYSLWGENNWQFFLCNVWLLFFFLFFFNKAALLTYATDKCNLWSDADVTATLCYLVCTFCLLNCCIKSISITIALFFQLDADIQQTFQNAALLLVDSEYCLKGKFTQYTSNLKIQPLFTLPGVVQKIYGDLLFSQHKEK